MAALIEPTLGPQPHLVGSDSSYGKRAPELLDSGGLIARRMLELSDPDADMGAMLLRNLLWRVHESAGDGTATTCVLFRSLFDQGLRYLAAGVNAQELRKYLLAGLDAINVEIHRLTEPVTEQAKLEAIAMSICKDEGLATSLAEILDVLGEHGNLEVREGPNRQLAWSQIEGAYWQSPVLSRLMLTDEADRRTDIHHCHVLYSDLEITTPDELLPVLEMARQEHANSLVIIAKKVSDSCLAVLLRNSCPDGFRAIAVRTPEVSANDQGETLDDIQALVGGTALRSAAGDSLREVRRSDLGYCRKAWADRQYFGLIGGKGDPARLVALVRTLRARHKRTDDRQTRARISRRIGNLSGSSAVLFMERHGGTVFEARKDLAMQTFRIMQDVLRDGAVPGAGTAYLACRPRLEALMASASSPAEHAAYSMLVHALEQPARSILSNAGFDPGLTLAKAQVAGDLHCCDVRTGSIVHAGEAGLLDSAAVASTAVIGAVRVAAQALTIDVLVHRREPEECVTP